MKSWCVGHRVEYQLAGEEVQQVFQHLNHSVIVPDGAACLPDTSVLLFLQREKGWEEGGVYAKWR
jgi:hypothetical protein